MKKTLVNFIVIILSLSVFQSCEGLDIPADGRLTIEDIFSNYHRVRNYYLSCVNYMPQVGFNYNMTPLASFSDEAHDASDGVAGPVNDWYNGKVSSTNNPVEGSYSWTHYFYAIRKCNTFLTNIIDPNITTAYIDEDEKNGWIAEVKTLRAFFYLQLLKRFGGVPIMTLPYEVTHDFSQDKRASVEEVVDFILSNCDEALATPESSKVAVGFRWNISDGERGVITRAFAYAVKSQAALYAASPLFKTPESKYTWDKVTEITKESLDQCLAHGFQLFNTVPAADVAQNAYAYYFILRSDPSRSVDKETIYETTAARTNVWKWAGIPTTDGMEKAGAGPSQELVDAYGMQATGEMPILGYSDASHLQPIINSLSGYDPEHPYMGRDPRFYASIYYNNSPKSLSLGDSDIDVYPLDFTPVLNSINVTKQGNETKLESVGGDPWIHTTTLGRPLSQNQNRVVTFEYKSNMSVGDAEFFFCVAGHPEGGISKGGIIIPEASDWQTFEYDLTDAIQEFGFGIDSRRGASPENHYLRFDITGGGGYELTIRNFRIESSTATSQAGLVQTYVGGNSQLSTNSLERRFTRTGYYLRKFNNHKSNANVDADGLMKIYRLGELYLNFAEAAYNAFGADVVVASSVAGGVSLSARDAVNAVRARAEMPEIPVGLGKQDFEKRYRNERQVELAFEDHRFFDVRRWMILHETDKFVTGMRIIRDGEQYVYNRFKLQDRDTYLDKYLWQPINLSEVTKMESVTGNIWQNPGW